MTGRAARSAVPAGSAMRHATVLRSDAVPDAVRMSCIENIVRIEVPEGDFCVRLEARGPGATRLRFQAAFREDDPAGGTWWSSWEVAVPSGPGTREVGRTLASEIRHSRCVFARAVSETVRRAA